MKICRNCREEKPISDFYAHTSRAGCVGYDHTCKACRCAMAKAKTKLRRIEAKENGVRRREHTNEWKPNKADLREQKACRRALGMGW